MMEKLLLQLMEICLQRLTHRRLFSVRSSEGLLKFNIFPFVDVSPCDSILKEHDLLVVRFIES